MGSTIWTYKNETLNTTVTFQPLGYDAALCMTMPRHKMQSVFLTPEKALELAGVLEAWAVREQKRQRQEQWRRELESRDPSPPPVLTFV